MRHLAAAATAALVVALSLLVSAGPAAAHAQLRASSPSAGERLEQPPEQLRLDFTESVSLTRDGFRLLDADGERQPLGDPKVTGATVTVPFPI